jgi:hypothetical protein
MEKKSDPGSGINIRIRNTGTLDTVFVFFMMYALELNGCIVVVKKNIGFSPQNLLRPDYGLHVLLGICYINPDSPDG